jgi:hypothetical protein
VREDSAAQENAAVHNYGVSYGKYVFHRLPGEKLDGHI